MSEKDLRRILDEVIDDIDTGRVYVTSERTPRRVRRMLGTAVLAAGLGLAGGACDSQSVGVGHDGGTQRDAAVQVDSGPDLMYGQPLWDAGPQPEYAEPFEDAGIMPAYGDPFWDAGGNYEYMAPPVDAGDITLYSAPAVDAGPDSGPNTAYGVPPCPPHPDDYDDEE